MVGVILLFTAPFASTLFLDLFGEDDVVAERDPNLFDDSDGFDDGVVGGTGLNDILYGGLAEDGPRGGKTQTPA
jgi:hypothetical protein